MKLTLAAIAVVGGCSSSAPPAPEPEEPLPTEPDQIVTIEDIAGPRPNTFGTFVGGRPEPATGVRQERRGVVVRTRGGIDYLVDPAGPTSIPYADAAWLGGEGFTGDLERIIWITAVTPRHVSVLIGQSEYTEGAAHANNSLRCATFDRQTGREVSLFDFVRRDGLDDAEVLVDEGDREWLQVCNGAMGGVVELRSLRLTGA